MLMQSILVVKRRLGTTYLRLTLNFGTIYCHKTSVTTSLRCLTFQKTEDLICVDSYIHEIVP